VPGASQAELRIERSPLKVEQCESPVVHEQVVVRCKTPSHASEMSPSTAMAAPENLIKPFTIAIDDKQLATLQQRLSTAIFPDELDDAGWSYGAPLPEIKRLVSYWKEGFDWRKQEAELNKFPQFLVPIDVKGFETLNIHFLHQRSEVERAVPLLFIHGCEFLE
jgi:hypothetical protein